MNMCRICLSNGPLKDIFETHVNNENKYVDIIYSCLGILLTELTTTSTKLCLKCVRKLKSFYKFKCLAVKNDAYLQSLNEDVVVKLEDIAYDINKIKLEEDSLYDYKVEDVDSLETKHEFEIKNNDTLETKYEFEIKESDSLRIKYEYSTDENTAPPVETADLEYEIELPRDTKKIKNGQKKVKTKQKGSTGKKPDKGKKKYYPPKKKMCTECGIKVNDLKHHMLRHMPEGTRPQFPCELCGKVMSNPRSRNRHIKAIHLGIKQVCKICNKPVSALSAHMKQIHNRERLNHKCVDCGRAFMQPSSLAAHMVTHSKERPFQCEHCKRTFQSKVRLAFHIRGVHLKEKPHLCQYCSKSFFKKCKLQDHIRSHTNERPFKCLECGKCFTSSQTLQGHTLTHGDERKFVCTECNMAFKKKDYLHSHMRTHTKEKRHPCQYCGVRFFRSDHRKRHEYTAHQKHLLPAAT